METKATITGRRCRPFGLFGLARGDHVSSYCSSGNSGSRWGSGETDFYRLMACLLLLTVSNRTTLMSRVAVGNRATPMKRETQNQAPPRVVVDSSVPRAVQG